MGTGDSRSVREKGPPNLRRPSAFYSDDYLWGPGVGRSQLAPSAAAVSAHLRLVVVPVSLRLQQRLHAQLIALHCPALSPPLLVLACRPPFVPFPVSSSLNGRRGSPWLTAAEAQGSREAQSVGQLLSTTSSGCYQLHQPHVVIVGQAPSDLRILARATFLLLLHLLLHLLLLPRWLCSCECAGAWRGRSCRSVVVGGDVG